MTDTPQSSADAGCLGTLVAIAVVSLILTLGMLQSFDSIGLYIPVFFVTTIVFASIGFPLYLVVRHFRRESLWSAMACGAATGAAVLLPNALAEGSARAWLYAAAYALTGIIGGIAFFLAANAARHPVRNVSFLIGITGVSAALAPVAAGLLT